MPSLLRLAIAVLSLALGVAAAGAQEPQARQSHPPSKEAGAQPIGQRDARSSRESLTQWRRERPPTARQADPENALAPGSVPGQDSRSISDAVRRVQRSTGGQILGAEQIPFEGRNITRVKYMDDRGRVRYMDDPGAPERRAPRRADNDAP